MYYQGAITSLLIVFFINLLLNLKFLRKLGDEKTRIPHLVPLISILVPARNEADNIANCLDSLCQQDYPNFEVLVLDDNSYDDTSVIVERIAASDSRVRLLRGKCLPYGWAGKPFACHQLATAAKGEWLLFTDADTIHAPRALSSALRHALKNNLSLVSGWPLQLCTSPSQRVVVPAFIFLILSWLPLWWLRSRKLPRFALTVGQFVFISTQDYWDIGGHEAVKSRILEDMWLGANAVRHGKRQEALDLSPMVSTRMYQSVGDLWEGFTKWVYSVACLSPLGLTLMMVAAFCCFVAPFLWLLWHFLPTQAPMDWFLLIVVQTTIVLLMRNAIDQHFQHPRLYVISHPISISFLILSCIYAGIRHVRGAGVRWKGRLYGPESRVG
jgi:chlorobactene glucosyltransferase